MRATNSPTGASRGFRVAEWLREKCPKPLPLYLYCNSKETIPLISDVARHPFPACYAATHDFSMPPTEDPKFGPGARMSGLPGEFKYDEYASAREKII